MAEVHLLSPAGFSAGAFAAGLKSRRARPDVGLLLCDSIATAAALFTTNKVFAAPIKIGRTHIARGKLRGIVVNSGNANAYTGRRGEIDALTMCKLAAAAVNCRPTEILPSSTGIIGHHLPMDKIRRGIAGAAKQLGTSRNHSLAFADAILTTDLVRKSAGVKLKIGRQPVTIAGVCKGSGMIGPRLDLGGGLHATMLAYLTTDAKIDPSLLRTLLAQSADVSFNAVTVDDHTSTNDTLAILASGRSTAIQTHAAITAFAGGLSEVCLSLARQIAADGEGATKVIVVTVRGAASESDAKRMARAIANSPLVKCAMHGNDPNWGRIVSAAGMCGAKFEPDRSVLQLQGVTVYKTGQPVKFDAGKVSRLLRAKEVSVDLACRLGPHSATVWTCDLSKDYVTINADYHT